METHYYKVFQVLTGLHSQLLPKFNHLIVEVGDLLLYPLYQRYYSIVIYFYLRLQQANSISILDYSSR